MQEMSRPIVEDPSEHKERRPFMMSFKGGVLLLICFLIGVAAAALLIYTWL
jgi:hypothetical protein